MIVGNRRLAEMHRLDRRARVYPHQAAAQSHKLFGADEVGFAKKDAIGEADLLLRLVKGIELLRRMLGVDDGNDGVQRIVCGDLVLDEERLRDRCRVGEPGGLDDDAIERLGLCLAAPTELAKNTHQVTANGAADAAVVHLDDLFGPAVDDQIVIDALFAKLILDDGDALAVAFAQNAVEQRGLAGTEKAGENCDRHLRAMRWQSRGVVISARVQDRSRRGRSAAPRVALSRSYLSQS